MGWDSRGSERSGKENKTGGKLAAGLVLLGWIGREFLSRAVLWR